MYIIHKNLPFVQYKIVQKITNENEKEKGGREEERKRAIKTYNSNDSKRRKNSWRKSVAQGSAIENYRQSLTNYTDPLNQRALFEGFRGPRAIEPARHSTLFLRPTLDSPCTHLGSHLQQTVITSSWTSKNTTIHHPVAHGSQPSIKSFISDLINVPEDCAPQFKILATRAPVSS